MISGSFYTSGIVWARSNWSLSCSYIHIHNFFISTQNSLISLQGYITPPDFAILDSFPWISIVGVKMTFVFDFVIEIICLNFSLIIFFLNFFSIFFFHGPFLVIFFVYFPILTDAGCSPQKELKKAIFLLGGKILILHSLSFFQRNFLTEKTIINLGEFQHKYQIIFPYLWTFFFK